MIHNKVPAKMTSPDGRNVFDDEIESVYDAINLRSESPKFQD